jgi:hypothetical protein
MKKTNKTKNIIYIFSIIVCLILLLIFFELKNINNNFPDTFYAEDVLFQIEESTVPSYRINFSLVSNLEKNYEDKSLLVKFKCYDKNGAMIADDVEAKIEKDEFSQGIMSYTSSCRSRYDEIVYCELNYVRVH